MRKIGRDPWRDLQILLADTQAPICFDVGAHRGETIGELVRHLPGAVIHAFEPDPENFAALQTCARRLPNVNFYQLALGDQQQTAKLQKTNFSMCNSLLSASSTLTSEAHKKIGEVEVAVTTLDEFCRDRQIERIDFLKTDCQGIDLRVLKGASKLLSAGRIRIIQCESLFMSEYEGQGWFYELLHFLTDAGYVPVSFVGPMRNEHFEIACCDVIFKRRE
jgi:FkbM family methyltransferase